MQPKWWRKFQRGQKLKIDKKKIYSECFQIDKGNFVLNIGTTSALRRAQRRMLNSIDDEKNALDQSRICGSISFTR